MKKKLFLIPLCLLLTACSDFLEYKDKDKIIPKTLTHFNELVFGEIIKQADGDELEYLDYMTDETEDRIVDTWNSFDDRVKFYPYFTWAVNHQVDQLGVEKEDKTWAWLYHKILMCNIVEHEVSALDEDLNKMRTRLLGEVACVRAISYFYLINLYGEVYENAEQAKSALGVPINDKIGVENIVYERASLQTIYDIIETDLKKAITFLEKGEQLRSKFRPNVNLAKLFLSRIYLFQKKYDQAIEICNDLISTSQAYVESRANLAEYVDGRNIKRDFFNGENPAMLFMWANRNASRVGSGIDKGVYDVAVSLIDAYGNDGSDIRKQLFFKQDYLGLFNPVKYQYSMSDYDRVYRIEEIYLNRAEALVELGGADNLAKALDDIHEIRMNRISGDYSLSATSRDEIRQALRDEKKLEFCFEEIRWFDIRRWGLEITHHYHDISNPLVYKTYVLRKGSPNYILGIPLTVQRRNDKIKQIEREETFVKEV